MATEGGGRREEKEEKMIHKLKIKEEFAEAILTGDKTFEVRLNDRGFQRHDRVRFTVIDNINVPHVSHPLHFKGEWLLDDYIKNYPDVKVLAWKPLEDPWRGEEDETDRR